MKKKKTKKKSDSTGLQFLKDLGQNYPHTHKRERERERRGGAKQTQTYVICVYPSC